MSTALNKSALKAMLVLKAMAGSSLKGITNQQLADGLDESPANITRHLQTLLQAGFVRKLDDGSYVLGYTLLGIAQAHSEEVNRATHRIGEHCQRVAAAANQFKSE